MDNAFYDILFYYYQEFRNKLLATGYAPKAYTSHNDVIKIIELGISHFVSAFEEWCTHRIQNINDIKMLIHCYSSYEKDINNKRLIPDNETIIGLNTIRFILAISPKLTLSKYSQSLFNDNKVYLPELFSMTHILLELTQLRCVESLSKESAIAIDLTKSWIGFSYIDAILESLLKSSKIRGPQILKPQLVDYDIPVKFQDVLSKTFGKEPVSLISELVTPYIIFNLDDMSEEDFIKLNNEELTPEDFSKYEQYICSDYEDICTYDISSFVNKHKNSDFVSEFILNISDADLYEVVTRPHAYNHRTRFKPIIELHSDNEIIFTTSKWLVFESYSELCLNRIPFHGMPEAWKKYKGIESFANQVHLDIGTKFERLVAKNISQRYKFATNIKHIGNISVVDAPIYINGILSKRTVGEIDFIIVNSERKIVYVADAKHIKSKYYSSSFYSDKSKFDGYYVKLQDKCNWVKNNMEIVDCLFDIDICSFSVEGCFITDSYVFYALFVDYPIIPLCAINDFLSTNDKFCYLSN